MEKLDMSMEEENKEKVHVTTDITITDYEQKIFDTLMEVRNLNKLNTIIRVNGGWVRDKMLQKDCKDIDFALDDISGAEFAAMLSAYLYPGQEHKFGVIKMNSEKSKHLETSTMKVHDMFIDLVNLRSEEYADDSRVPTIRIGTPLEDALRRDLTFNSMFYNINEKKIEDFTGKGIDDLKFGIVRTPLDPLQTFIDDPLRVLRTIRFTTRFGFTMVDEIIDAINNPKIKEYLASKVSFERIGKETDLMFEGENPADSIKYFYDFKIFTHILKFPESCAELKDEEFVNEQTYVSLKVSQVLGILIKDIKKDPNFLSAEWPKDGEFKEMQKYLFYSAILVPFKDYVYTFKKGSKSKTEKVHGYVMYESLKQPNKGKIFSTACLESLDSMITLVNSPFDVLKVGCVVKDLGEYIKPVLLLSLATEYYRDYLADKSQDIDRASLGEVIAKYTGFYESMKEHKIEIAHLIQPLMNGKAIMELYKIKGGPLMKKLTDEVFKWQVEHPDGTLEELQAYMLANRDSFTQG
eukprot:CAMPEP_0168342574 /NCGR_PEP_ID=MMETSP0213-20121227/15478_1 /TAXON_ID=151035 /ORGANISM="Euplotes harpa, Strain FSP1.4" /LENGTH=521 /DNA_ID=CAMNT_0008349503 /DNA_START=86 /DNA_END=1651 /DNA_ORIENTATION=+